MKIPFYYSFKEFENNYNNDFKKWLSDYPDAIEKDYLFELKEQYEVFVRWSGNYRFDEIITVSYIGETEYPETAEISNMEDYCNYVEQKIKDHLVDIGIIDNVDSRNSESSFNGEMLEYWDDCNFRTNRNSLVFESAKHKYLKHFFENHFFYGLNFQERKYKNFKYSVVKIAEYIDEKIKPPTKELKKISEIETPEIETKTKTPFTTPEKIALLQVTELEKYFDTLTGDIADQKYRLLSALFGVSFDTVKKCYTNNTINISHKKRAKDFYNQKFNESK